MKKLVASVFAIVAGLSLAAPSSNNFHSVTNDWYNGNFSNVYELAQMRLTANTNDLVGAYLMLEWDTCFSDFSAMSQSVARLIRSADGITEPPSFTNHYMRMRNAYIYFRDEFLPAQADSERVLEQHKDRSYRTHLLCSKTLELLWEVNLWQHEN